MDYFSERDLRDKFKTIFEEDSTAKRIEIMIELFAMYDPDELWEIIQTQTAYKERHALEFCYRFVHRDTCIDYYSC
jgi:hypothetical protein